MAARGALSHSVGKGGGLLMFCAALLLSACQRDQGSYGPTGPDNGDNNQTTIEATFSSIQQNILTPGCVNRGCHPPAGPMSLKQGEAYQNLVNQPSAYGMPRVDPGKPDNSALYLKVVGDARTGARMPLNAPPLSQEQIDAIRTWIQNGAKND
ncbi:MAG: hypothetical protein Q9P90_13140 [candidate division KSB1 bacterium]|nr:hypothetical protein [candidate division KSB1 bacterium]